MQSLIKLETVESLKVLNQISPAKGGFRDAVPESGGFESVLSSQIQQPAGSMENENLREDPLLSRNSDDGKSHEEALQFRGQPKPADVKNERKDAETGIGTPEDGRRMGHAAQKPAGKEPRRQEQPEEKLRAGMGQQANKPASGHVDRKRPEAPNREDEMPRKKQLTKDPSASLLSHIQHMLTLLKSARDTGRELKELKQVLSEARDALARHKDKADRSAVEQISARLKVLAKKIEGLASSGIFDGVIRRELKLVKNESVLLAEALKAGDKRSERMPRDFKKSEMDAAENKKGSNDRISPILTVSGDEVRESPVLKNQAGNTNLEFQFMKNSQAAEKIRTAPAPVHKPPLFDEQMQSIIQNAKVTVRDAKNGSFSLRLYPESLGRVNVNLGLEQGTLTGRFLVDTVEVKQALLEQVSILRDQLQEAGISVGEFQVNVRDGGSRPFNHEEPPPGGFYRAPLAEMSGRYETNSMRHHDGALDVII